jgi:hypothetical protein
MGNFTGSSSGRGSVLSVIREGMEIYDATNDNIGKVEFVRFGAESERQNLSGTGPATPGRGDELVQRADSFIDNLAEAFRPNDMPEQLRERLLLSGFIVMDAAGLFAKDRIITPDQISGVVDEKVQLSVTRDQLIERTWT